MMGKVVKEPVRGHACNPGWVEGITTKDDDTGVFPKGSRYSIPPSQFTHPAGTVWECDCGKTYVSKPPRDIDWPGDVTWRREHWWERRARLRRMDRDA